MNAGYCKVWRCRAKEYGWMYCSDALCKKHLSRCPCRDEQKRYEKAKKEGRICSDESCNRICNKDDRCFTCEKLFCKSHSHSSSLHKERFSSDYVFVSDHEVFCDECWEKTTPIEKYEKRVLVRKFTDNLILVEKLYT